MSQAILVKLLVSSSCAFQIFERVACGKDDRDNASKVPPLGDLHSTQPHVAINASRYSHLSIEGVIIKINVSLVEPA